MISSIESQPSYYNSSWETVILRSIEDADATILLSQYPLFILELNRPPSIIEAQFPQNWNVMASSTENNIHYVTIRVIDPDFYPSETT